MTERERLIELLMKGELEADKQGVFNCSQSKWKAEIMADFLLENGVIVPPVKVGDTVYTIYRGYVPACIKWAVLDASTKYITTDGGLYSYDKIGKTIFLTREEAEKALKERE